MTAAVYSNVIGSNKNGIITFSRNYDKLNKLVQRTTGGRRGSSLRSVIIDALHPSIVTLHPSIVSLHPIVVTLHHFTIVSHSTAAASI